MNLKFSWRWMPVNIAMFFLLTLPIGTALAKDDATRIADAIGPVTPHVLLLVDIGVKSSVLSEYRNNFRNYASMLSKDDWLVVTRQLTRIANKYAREMSDSLNGNEPEYRLRFLEELQKLKPEDLPKFASFLESDDGRMWLKGEAEYLRWYQSKMRRSVLPTLFMLYLGREDPAAELKRPDKGISTSSLRLRNAELLSSTGLSLNSGVPTLGQFAQDIDDRVAAVVLEADETRKRAFPLDVRTLALALARAVVTIRELPSTKSAFDAIQEPMNNEVRSLSRRSFLAIDASTASLCPPLDQSAIRGSGGQVRKLVTPKGPAEIGSNEHAWLAMSYELGCGVPKDYAVAFKLWMEFAEAGGVKTFCKIADWHRWGLGTKKDEKAAQAWEAKFSENAFGGQCERGVADPRSPWAGLPN